MTQGEEQTIRNVIARLKERHCGCGNPTVFNDAVKQMVELSDSLQGTMDRNEVVSRIYLDTWIVPALELLLPGAERDVDLARRLSGR